MSGNLDNGQAKPIKQHYKRNLFAYIFFETMRPYWIIRTEEMSYDKVSRVRAYQFKCRRC